MKHNITLKLRITILLGIVLAAIAVMMTAFGVFNSNQYFVEPQKKNIASFVKAIDPTMTAAGNQSASVQNQFEVQTGVAVMSKSQEISYGEEIPGTSLSKKGSTEVFENIGKEDYAITFSLLSPWNIEQKNILTYHQTEPIKTIDVGAQTIKLDNMIVTVTQAQKSFFQSSIYVMIGIMLAGLIFIYLMVGRALKPLTDLSETIASIGEHNLNEVIYTNHTADEIASLTNSFNKMLGRLKHAFDNQKHFSANAAHELKTPLAIMKTSLQVLDMEQQPSVEDYKSNVQVVENSVDRLIEIVHNLLLLSVSDIELNEKINFNTIVAECLNTFSNGIEAKQLLVHCNEEPCTGIGNQALVASAVSNLIENAIKYNCMYGTVSITLVNHGSMIRLTVSDTGIGITEDNLENIFKPFFRAEQSRSKEISGNGLGLSIVKNVIEKHHGSIQIESEFGNGTKITIELPRFN